MINSRRAELCGRETRRQSTGFGDRAIRASKIGAQAQKVLPIVPSVKPPVTAAPIGVRVISVSAVTPVAPGSVIPRPYRAPRPAVRGLTTNISRPIANAFLAKLDPQTGNDAEPFMESEAV